MSLIRVWRPSPNYSSGRPSSRLLVLHTSEGATTEESLANFLAQPSAQVSYHVCFDNIGDTNSITECVAHNNKSWSAMNANSWGEHGCCCTPSGASQGWSRDTWLSKGVLLEKCAAWLAEEAARYGVALTKISAGDISAGRSGVCGHGDCSAAGAGGSHSDPGPNFPWDHVMALAGGQVAPAPSPPAGAGPPFPGTYLINYTAGHGTATWQARMAERGWTIAVDDQYGEQSEGVCRSFQYEKGLGVDGIVGPITWEAAWSLPVT